MIETKVSRRDSLRNIAALGVTGAVVALGANALTVGSAEAAQPHMSAALNALQNALGQLEAAASDKGGHRVAAIALVKQAIAQVTQGMAVGAM